MNELKNEQLILAAKIGYVNMVNALLAKGANVNHADTSGNTALMWAAINGYLNIVKFLVAKGADINHVNQDGNTALNTIINNGLQNKLEDLFYEEYKEFLLNLEREKILKNHLINSTELFQNNPIVLEHINIAQYLNTKPLQGKIKENLKSIGLNLDEQKIIMIKNHITEWSNINKSEINSMDLQIQLSTSGYHSPKI